MSQEPFDSNPDRYSGMGYSPEYQRSGNENPSVLEKAKTAQAHFERRGMGKTGLTTRPVSDGERLTICMLRGKGLSYDEIAEKLKRSKATIQGVINRAETLAKTLGLNFDWRADIKEKSIVALRAGLMHTEDPYKRANLGIAGLKGLGEFEGEGGVNVQTLINAVPDSQRDRYVTLEVRPVVKQLAEGESNGEAE